VTLRHGRRFVFPGTDWTWQRGERWAILGPDGGGKSFFVQALLGRVPILKGDVQGPCAASGPDDADPEQVIAWVSPEVQRRVVLAESSFYQARWHSGIEHGERTVAQFLSQESVEGHNPYEVNPRGESPRQFQIEQRRWSAALELNPLWHRRLAHLSNGELRKTLLAHALLRRPRLLVLEDSYSGLDVATRRILAHTIDRLMRTGLPVLVVTDRREEIPSAATHLLCIDQCRVMAQGRKPSVLRLWRQGTSGRPQRAPGLPPAVTGPSSVDLRSGHRALTRPVLELRHVTIVGHTKTILDNISWTVREGERWLVLGPNGAGKSTLLNLIQGDHPQAYAQEIKLFGRETDSTHTLWQSRQQIGWMSPELHQHYPVDWRVLDVVLSGFYNTLGLFQSCTRRQRAAARRYLEELGLVREARMAFGELGFGQQRLVLLARAAVKRPHLLILDEPTQGMDAAQRVTLLAAVDRAAQHLQGSLLFVTHYQREIPGCITHRLRLKEGKVILMKPRVRS
jgi:molybdate transport system ATP-binding protein